MSPLRPRRLLDATLVVSTAAVALLGQRVVTAPPVPEGVTQVLGVQIARGDQVAPGQGKKVFGITGDVDSLAPGVDRSLRLTLSNPNTFAIAVDSLSVAVSNARAGCPSTHVRVAPFTGPRTVPANGAATTDLVVTLLNSAPDACKGSTFSLRYSGTAVKVNQS